MNPNFKVYFSKSSRLPCVEFRGQLFKAENLEINVPTKGEWRPYGESPSWVLVGEANFIERNQQTDTITIN